MTDPIARRYVVPQTGLVAGAYPGSLSPAWASRKIAALLAARITTFINLADFGELIPYLPVLRELESANPDLEPATVLRYPMSKTGIPSVAQMREVLYAVNDALGRGERVYLHCWSGTRRTATVVGCHLVEHGLQAEDALAEVARLSAAVWGPEHVLHPDGSPETEGHHDLVRSWRPGMLTRWSPPPALAVTDPSHVRTIA